MEEVDYKKALNTEAQNLRKKLFQFYLNKESLNRNVIEDIPKRYNILNVIGLMYSPEIRKSSIGSKNYFPVPLLLNDIPNDGCARIFVDDVDIEISKSLNENKINLVSDNFNININTVNAEYNRKTTIHKEGLTQEELLDKIKELNQKFTLSALFEERFVNILLLPTEKNYIQSFVAEHKEHTDMFYFMLMVVPENTKMHLLEAMDSENIIISKTKMIELIDKVDKANNIMDVQWRCLRMEETVNNMKKNFIEGCELFNIMDKLSLRKKLNEELPINSVKIEKTKI